MFVCSAFDVLEHVLRHLSVSRHFGPKTFWHWCRSAHKTLRHQCRSVRTLRHWCRNVRKTLRYRSVFGVVCAIVCCDITIASRIGLAWRFCTCRNRFNAVYLKHDKTDGTAIDWADRTAIVPVTVTQSPPSVTLVLQICHES